jgi:hypothetical protein
VRSRGSEHSLTVALDRLLLSRGALMGPAGCGLALLPRPVPSLPAPCSSFGRLDSVQVTVSVGAHPVVGGARWTWGSVILSGLPPVGSVVPLPVADLPALPPGWSLGRLECTSAPIGCSTRVRVGRAGAAAAAAALQSRLQGRGFSTGLACGGGFEAAHCTVLAEAYPSPTSARTYLLLALFSTVHGRVSGWLEGLGR